MVTEFDSFDAENSDSTTKFPSPVLTEKNERLGRADPVYIFFIGSKPFQLIGAGRIFSFRFNPEA
jgi:hypothetical protein